jgi:uncharacterized protein YciI
MADLPSRTPAVYTVVLYEYVDNMLERRKPYREAHLARLDEAKARGELLNAGAFGDADSAVLDFAPGLEAVAQAFADGDPYVLADLVPSRRVTTWNVVT